MSNDSSPDKGQVIARSAAELERLSLEIEKLKIEIPKLRRSQSIDSLVRLTPLITVLIAIFGLTFTVYQYKAEQRKNRVARGEQLTKEAGSAQREFMKPLLEKQQQLYFEASSAASIIASTNNSEERKKAEETFWKLYWGPLVFVESKEVSEAMQNFGDCLSRAGCSNGELQNLSLALASKMETSMLKTWNAKPEDFAQNQFVYR